MHTGIRNVRNPDLLVCILVVIKGKMRMNCVGIYSNSLIRVFASQNIQRVLCKWVLQYVMCTICVALERKSAKMHLPKFPRLQVPDVFSQSS